MLKHLCASWKIVSSRHAGNQGNRRGRAGACCGLVLLILSLCGPQYAHAATVKWTAGSGNDFNWDTVDFGAGHLSNWDKAGNVAPSAADDVVFDTPIPNPGSLANPETITLGAGERANSLAFNDTYVFNGGDLTLTTSAITVAATKTATINSNLTSATGLALTGGGTLALGSGTYNFTGGAVSVSGASTLSIASDAALSGATGLTLNNGTLAATGTFTMALGVTLGAGGGTINTATGADVTLASIVAGTGGLTKAGVASLILNGANTYSGVTTVSAGELVVGHNTALGATGVGNETTVTSGARVVLADGITVTGEEITIAGDGGTNNYTGALQAAGTGTWAGSIKLGTAARIGARSSGTLTVSGIISDGAGTDLFISGEAGTGTVVLSGANTYTGRTNIVRGVVKLDVGNDRLPTGTILDVHSAGTGDAATFDLNGFNQTIGGLASSDTSGPATVTNSSLTTGSTLTINVATGGTYTYGGTITGNVALVKNGPGAQTLGGVVGTGASTLSVNGGLLTMGDVAHTFTGAVTIDGAGSVLAYTGQGNGDPTHGFGAGGKTVTLTNGGAIRPLTASDPSATNTKQFVIGTGGGIFDIPDGSSLMLNDANQFSGTGNLTVTGAGTGYVQLGQPSVGYAGFTGNVIISSATLKLLNTNAVGNTAGQTITVASGAVLDVQAANIPQNITLNGTGISNGGALINSSGTAGSIAGNVTLGSAVSVGGTGTGGVRINGLVSGAFGLTKVGTNTVTLAGNNTTFSGPILSQGGLLGFTTLGGLGDASATNTITLDGGGISYDNTTALTFTRTINVTTAGGAIGVAQTGGPLTFNTADLIKGGGPTAIMTKAGAGTLTLNAANPNLSGSWLVAGGTLVAASKDMLGTTTPPNIQLSGGGVARIYGGSSTPASAGVNGLNASYYAFGANLNTNDARFAADILLPGRVFSRIDTDPNALNMPTTSYARVPVTGLNVPDSLGMMWKGLVNVTTAGDYTFRASHDDNFSLYIDGKVYMADLPYNANNTTFDSATVNLSAGAHSIVMKFTQGGGGKYLIAQYAGPDTGGATAFEPIGATPGRFTTGSMAPDVYGIVGGNGTMDIYAPRTAASVILGNGDNFALTSPTLDNLTITGASTLSTATTAGTLSPTTGALIFNGAIGEVTPGSKLTIAGPYLTQFNAPNTYTGLTSVTGGRLELNATGGNAIAGDLTVNVSNTGGYFSNVVLKQASQIADTATVTVGGNAIVDLGANSESVNKLALQSRGTIMGSSTLNVADLSSSTFEGGILLANLGGGGAGQSLTKTTTGTTVLAGNNTFIADSNIIAGVLNVRGNNAFGAATNNVSVSSGAAIEFQGNGASTVAGLSLGGAGIVYDGVNGTGAVRNIAGNSVLNATTITLGEATTIQSESGNLTINGTINGSAASANLAIQGAGDVTLNAFPTLGSGTLTKNGTGALVLNYNVGATIPAMTWNGGVLGFKGPQSLGTATVGTTGPAGASVWRFDSDPGAGNTIAVPAGKGVIGNFDVNQTFLGRIDPASAGYLALGQTNTNNLDFTSLPSLSLGASAMLEYTGTITPGGTGYRLGGGGGELRVRSVLSGANPLTVSGAGVVYLHDSVVNTFTGNVTVDGGVLRIAENDSLGNSANTVTLTNGGRLTLIQNSTKVDVNFGMLGNPIGQGSRQIVVGTGGGTIAVEAYNNLGNAYALSGTNPLTGSGTLTKTEFGELYLLSSTDFSGGMVLAPQGGGVELRATGALPNVTSFELNNNAYLIVDNQNGFGSRQFASVNNNDRINNAATIDMRGGLLYYRARNTAGQTAETFGAATLTREHSVIRLEPGGQGADVTFANLVRNLGGGTVRFESNGNFTFGATGNNPRLFFTQINGAASATTNLIGGWAFISNNSANNFQFAGYNTTSGVVPSTMTAQGAAIFTPTAGTIYDLNAAGTATLAAIGSGAHDMAGLRFSNNAAQTLAFGDGSDTLYIESGGILDYNYNQARTIGATGATGKLTAGSSTAPAGAKDLFFHINQNTTNVYSEITDNNGAVTLVKDMGGVLELKGANSYSGGTLLFGGRINALAANSLGSGSVLVKGAALEIRASGVTGNTSGIIVRDQSELYLNANINFTGASDRFIIEPGSTITSDTRGTTRLGSLTRVPMSTFTGSPAGGQVVLYPEAIVRSTDTPGGDIMTNMIKNLGTDADLYYNQGGGFDQNQFITVGAGTPWKGISSSVGTGWELGTILANGDFWLQGLARIGTNVALTMGKTQSIGTWGVVNQAGKPISAFITGQVALNEDTPVNLPSDLTFVVTRDGYLQPNYANSFGSLELFGSRAKVLVKAGGTLDPGSYTPINPHNDPALYGKQYALPSPINTDVTVDAGGRLLINDGSGIGSVTGGATWTMKTASILQLDTANAFFGSENGLVKSSGSPFVFEPGAIVRIYNDNRVYKMDQFVSGATGGAGVIYEIVNGDRNLTEYLDPFTAPATGTPRAFGYDLTIGAGGGVTNDVSDRHVRNRRGTVYLANGASLMATTQTYLYMDQNVGLLPNANITIGASTFIDGLPKLGTVRFGRENSNTGDNTTSFSLLDGTQILIDTTNVIPDATSINLPTPATTFTFPSTGPGTAIALNSNGNTEFIGKLTGAGTVFSNQDTAALGVGFGATTDFTFDGVIKAPWASGDNKNDPQLIKVGPTKMTMTNTSDSTGIVTVYQGELSFVGANGKSASGNMRLSRGGTLTFDNTINVVTDRFLNTGGWLTTMGGGDFKVLGNATDVGDVTIPNLATGTGSGIPSYSGGNPGGVATLSVVPSGDLSTLRTSLTFNQFENVQNAGERLSTYLVRGVGAAGLPGSFSNTGVYTPNPANPKDGLVFFNNPRFTFQGGFDSNMGGAGVVGAPGSPIVPVRGDLLASADPNATQGEFATIDVTTGAGRTAVRPLQASEYSNIGPVVGQNATVSLNVRAPAGAALNYGNGDSRFQVLRMENGSSLNVSGVLPALTQPAQVVLNGGGILVPTGATASITTGANNVFRTYGGVSAYIHAYGNLNVNGEFFSDQGIVKTGPGTVTFAAGSLSNTRGRFAVNEGTVIINDSLANVRDVGTGQAAFNPIYLALNGGVLDINGKDQLFGRFESGNILAGATTEGGTLTSTAPANVGVIHGGTFSGHVTGNISLRKFGNNTLFLTNTNTTAGTVKIDQGTLSLRDGGTLPNITSFDINYARLDLDNGWLAGVASRISPTATLNMRGGSFIVRGRAGTLISTSVGTANLLAGNSLFQSVAGGGGANETTINNLVRSPGATLQFNQDNGFLGTPGNDSTAIRYLINQINGGALTLTNDILPAWIIVNNDHFATYLPGQGISYLSNTEDGYANYSPNNLLTGGPNDNISDGAARTLTVDKTIYSFRQTGSTMNLGGFTLTLASGGLLGRNGGNVISNGKLTSGTGELNAFINDNMTISAQITGSIALTKAGNATLTLTGNNNYTGATYVSGSGGGSAPSGTLTLNTASADGTTIVAIPGDLHIHNSTVNESLPNQIAKSANVYMYGGSIFNLRDATNTTETLASIVFMNAAGDNNARPIVNRANQRPSSTLALTGATPITSTNENPQSTPAFGQAVGGLAFTGAAGTPQTLMITSPVSMNGLAAAGLIINAKINAVPAGVAEGGLVKDGSGLLILGASHALANSTTTNTSTSLVVSDTTGLVAGMPIVGSANIPAGTRISSIVNATTITMTAAATGSATNVTATFIPVDAFGNPAAATDVFNIKNGYVRVDTAGSLGPTTAVTTVQSGATLLLNNGGTYGLTGSLRLKNGSTLGMTMNNSNLGDVGSAGTVEVPGGATVTAQVRDYFVPSTNTGNIIVNHKLTGSGTINLVGIDYAAGYNGGGVFQLRNLTNDFSGIISVGTNAVLEANSNDVSATGNTFGSATINLNGGLLRARDQGDNTTGAQTITYGNNVNLLADSYLNLDRQGTVAQNKTIAFGSLTVPSGAKSLYVNNGNNFHASFTELAGPGTLVFTGNSYLDITALSTTTVPSIAVNGPQGMNLQASGLNFNLAAGNHAMANLSVNGVHTIATGRNYTVNSTVDVGSNAGAVLNGMGYDATKAMVPVANGNVVGALAINTGATLTTATLRNNGVVGPDGGAATVNATTLVGSGLYNAYGNDLTLNGTVANDGATPTTLKVAGNKTVILPTVGHTFTGGVEVQGATLRVAPSASAVDPLPTTGTIRTYGQPITALAAGSQPISQTGGTLEFAAGANTITQNGTIVNNGAVRVSSGTVNITNPLAGTNFASLSNEADFIAATKPGLLEGFFSGTSGLDASATRAANPGQFGITLEPRRGQENLVTQNPLTGWGDNQTWVYTGFFYDADGKFTFAENIDDRTLVSIDGVTRLYNQNSNITSTATTAGQRGTTPATNQNAAAVADLVPTSGTGIAANPNLPAGWHSIEIRFQNGTGGAGPWGTSNGFTNNYGFGWNPDGTMTLDGTQFFRPIDNGTGNLFRTAVYGKGNVQVDAGATLNVPQITNTNKLSMGASATGAVVNLNAAAATTSTVDALEVTGTTGTATLTTLGTSSLTVGNFSAAAGTTLTHNGPTNRLVITGNAAGGTINSTGAAGVTFNSDFAQNASTIIAGSGGLIKQGTGTLTLNSANTYTGPTQITGGTIKLGSPWGGTGSPFTKVPEAAQYKTVYKLSIPDNPDFDAVVPYSEDHSNDGTIGTGSFNRVAYFLELKKPTDTNSTWAWVSMDASPFTTDLSKMGIPTPTNGVFFHYDTAGLLPGQVRNMNVATNAASGVTAGTGITTGNVEFWPSNYGTGNDYGVPGASDTTFDFGDGAAGPGAGHGSMQIFNYATGEMIFGMNHFNAGGTNQAGIFIGNDTSTANPDGTFVYNSAGYSVKDLWVLVGNAGAGSSYLPINTAVSISDNASLDLNSNNQTIGSLAGTSLASVLLGSGTLTTGNDNANATYAGTISGTGGITKIGTGIQTIAGGTHTGTTTIVDGTLATTKSLASSDVIADNSAGGKAPVFAADLSAGAPTAPKTVTVKSLALTSGPTAADTAKAQIISTATGAGALFVNAPATPTTLQPTGLTLTGSSAMVDVKTNGLVLDYGTSPATDPTIRDAAMAQVRAWIISGRGTGVWDGTAGIGSTSAAADVNNRAVGYMDSSLLGTGTGGKFMTLKDNATVPGVDVNGTSVLVRYTIKGDSNLDGKVDFIDLVAVAQHYNWDIAGGKNVIWSNGDFDYSGKVDFADLVAVAQHYNNTLPAAASIPGATPDFSADWANALTMVPEPGTLTLLALGSLFLMRRNNRRKAA